MRFYNSLTRRTETFEPLDPACVRLYTCGPTVYNFAHIGNFRAYVFEDILRRTIEFAGWPVKQVMNLTDVDDKTIRGSREKGIPLRDYTKPYKEAFFADLKTLGVEPAEVYPAATDHIPEMIALIQRLFDKGVAYQSDDKSVYFSVAKFPEYGKLAHLDREGMRSGVRIANDEYEKDAVGDFALWKAWDEKDGDVWWDSPWGRGRPGWHIECSAMSMKYLGESFDLHTGGIDNLFPHHENEIAQAEAATGKPFVRTWLHCAHLRVNGEKMSKSLGNFFTLRDLLDKGYTGREIRYVLLSAHYRQPLNFTFDALAGARTALARIDEFAARLRAAGARDESEVQSPKSEVQSPKSEVVAKTPDSELRTPNSTPDWAADALRAFSESITEDLGTPGALAAVHGLVSAGNRAFDAAAPDAATATAVLAVLRRCDRVLNLLPAAGAAEAAVPAEVQALADQRAAVRAEKNWAESDRLRAAIAALGWEVRDSKAGQTLRKAP